MLGTGKKHSTDYLQVTPGEYFTISAVLDGGGDKYLLDIKSLRFELLIEMGLRPSNLVPTKCVVT